MIGALEHISSLQPGRAPIATNSKCALQARRNLSPTNNRDLLTHIHNILHTLHEEGMQLSFSRIPSYIGIHWNEKADTVTKEVTLRPVFEVEVLRSLSISKKQTAKHFGRPVQLTFRKYSYHQTYLQIYRNRTTDFAWVIFHLLKKNNDIEPPACNHCQKNKTTTTSSRYPRMS